MAHQSRMPSQVVYVKMHRFHCSTRSVLCLQTIGVFVQNKIPHFFANTFLWISYNLNWYGTVQIFQKDSTKLGKHDIVRYFSQLLCTTPHLVASFIPNLMKIWEIQHFCCQQCFNTSKRRPQSSTIFGISIYWSETYEWRRSLESRGFVLMFWNAKRGWEAYLGHFVSWTRLKKQEIMNPSVSPLNT